MIVTLLVFLGSILVLVGIHEAGHFLAAKLLGVRVLEFAIGIGPALVSRQGRVTRYTIRAFPIGGYVRMAGEDRREDDESIPEHEILYNKPAYVRALISVAGPAANLALALFVSLMIVWGFGLPMIQVARVQPDSPAADALRPGDRVVTIDKRRVYSVDDVSPRIQASEGEAIAFTVSRDGERATFDITPVYVEDEARYIVGAHFYPVTFTSRIEALEPTAPLWTAGVRADDSIVSVDGAPIETWIGLIVRLDELAAESDAVTLSIARGGQPVDVGVSLAGHTVDELLAGASFADLGISMQRPGPIDGLILGGGRFVDDIRLLGTWVRQLIGGEVSVSDSIAGPVGVAQTLGQGLRLGPSAFFRLLAFLSLNFGLLNLVPFPALDGSRIVFALCEWVRGKPIPPEREGMIHAIGFLVLLGLMILITYQDIVRLFR